MIRLFLLLLLVIPLESGYAQPYQHEGTPVKKTPQFPIANQFEHLSVRDGLSNNSVTCILQDRNGFMWFGTNDGLNKYDGHTFTVFRANPRQPARSLRNSVIMGLCEGGPDQMWIVTLEGGLHEINTKTGLVTPHPIRAVRAKLWNRQNSVYKDSQGVLWISTFAGLARYEPRQHRFILYPAPDSKSAIVSVYEDRQHRFWVATVGGMFLFNRATGKFTQVPIPGLSKSQLFLASFFQDKQDRLWIGMSTAGYSLLRLHLREHPWRFETYNPGGKLNPFVFRSTLHQDSTGILWVGTTNGLYGIDPTSDKVVTYHTDPNLVRGLSSSYAQAVYHDRAGAIWIGTDNGIDRQGVNTKSFTTYQVTPNERMASRPENRVNALMKDSRDQVWFTNGSTVYCLSASKHLAVVPPDKLGSIGKRKNDIHCFLPDGRDGIWFGTKDGLYHYNQRSGQYSRYPSEIPVQYLARSSAANRLLWFGGEGGIASFNPYTHQYTYYKHDPENAKGLPDKDVNGLLVSQFDEVWVLIKHAGVCRLNPRTGKMTRYTAGPRGHLSSNDVVSIYEDRARDGIIWVGTQGGGLNRFDWRPGLFSTITHQDGIPGNTILAITGDRAGNLWLSTDRGLCRVDPISKAIHGYAVTDGLPTDEFLQNAVFRLPGQLFFGSQNGFVQFNPSRILDDTRPFPVHITGLTVGDKPRLLTDSIIRLNHDENLLSFSFAALSYEQPQLNQYAYKLVGVNPKWVQNGNRHVANYTNLAPGTYTFRVKAANNNGYWSTNEASLQVIVLPPWWATWWAYGLYTLMAGGTVWGYIRFYTNRIKQRQELALNRREAEQLKALDELKTRFFSNITHEFRTPLSLIIAPVEKLLRENRFDRPTLTLVHQNAQQLLRLINQLLDLSKLEGNYMAVAFRQGEVAEFIEYIVELFRRSAEQKGITLTSMLEDLPAQEYLFDADKWEKILTNLLSNALKFTPSGGRVTLKALPVWEADRLRAVQIELNDSGIGITPEQLPHIFDRFYQADTSNTRAYEGTGIGLALVKELVSLLGGTISVESQLGAGTTFHLTLPIQPVSADVNAPKVDWSAQKIVTSEPIVPASPVSLANPSDDESGSARIVVVEDNDELRDFLVGELSQSYLVLQAADGEAGWKLTQAELPDIVLTDVMMPRMDGNQLTQLIKGNTDTNHIAVVMLTAKAAQQSRLDGLQQGADDYLAKPFSIDELHLRLRNLTTRQHRLGERYRQQFALPAEQNTPPELNQDPFLLKIYTLLDAHLSDSSISVDWLADQLAMNRRTLHRKVHSLIQLPPADLIRQYRLRRAAELLRAGHNVSETADLVGFSTASHFSNVFKDFYHKTPSEFMNGRG